MRRRSRRRSWRNERVATIRMFVDRAQVGRARWQRFRGRRARRVRVKQPYYEDSQNERRSCSRYKHGAADRDNPRRFVKVGVDK